MTAIELIDLVIQLTPQVIAELNTLFSGLPITAADCHTVLTKFEADLTVFKHRAPGSGEAQTLSLSILHTGAGSSRTGHLFLFPDLTRRP